MKVAAVFAVTLALAMSAQASIIPLAHHDIALAAPVHVVSSPLVHAVHHVPGSVAVHASAVPLVHGVHGVHASVVSPVVHGLHSVHGAIALDGHLGHGLLAHGHEGHYVAKTRGAVHTAPLAGHLASASSINLAPAPGTI